MQIGHLSVLCQPKDRYSKKNGFESKLSWFHLHFKFKYWKIAKLQLIQLRYISTHSRQLSYVTETGYNLVGSRSLCLTIHHGAGFYQLTD